MHGGGSTNERLILLRGGDLGLFLSKGERSIGRHSADKESIVLEIPFGRTVCGQIRQNLRYGARQVEDRCFRYSGTL